MAGKGSGQIHLSLSCTGCFSPWLKSTAAFPLQSFKHLSAHPLFCSFFSSHCGPILWQQSTRKTKGILTAQAEAMEFNTNATSNKTQRIQAIQKMISQGLPGFSSVFSCEHNKMMLPVCGTVTAITLLAAGGSWGRSGWRAGHHLAMAAATAGTAGTSPWSCCRKHPEPKLLHFAMSFTVTG